MRVSSAQLVSKGPPRSCVRHGKPVITGTDVGLQSTPKQDMSPTFGGVLAIVVRTVDHLEQIKQVPVRGWPFCAECVRRRQRLRRTAQALFVGGVAMVIAAVLFAIVSQRQEPLLMIPMVLGFVAAVTSGFVFGQSGWTRIANAQVSDDGRWVTFANAHPQFAAEMRSVGEGTGS